MPNISRKNMPQVDTQNLSKAINMVSDKVRVTKGKIAVGKLKKSQRELHRDKIEGIAARFTTPNKFKPLIISKDNHIVDGLYANGVKLYNVSREDRRKFKKALCCMPLHLKVVMDMHVKTTR